MRWFNACVDLVVDALPSFVLIMLLLAGAILVAAVCRFPELRS